MVESLTRQSPIQLAGIPDSSSKNPIGETSSVSLGLPYPSRPGENHLPALENEEWLADQVIELDTSSKLRSLLLRSSMLMEVIRAGVLEG